MRSIERVADPQEFIGEPEKNRAVLDHLNLYLEDDDLEIVLKGRRACARKKGIMMVA